MAQEKLITLNNLSTFKDDLDIISQASLDGKVDKETGKGLSTNDYTTADKNKLADIEAEANKTVVDSSMSDSSTNPLQNKVITKELEGAKTATGNPLTIEDASPVNAVNLSVDLESIQDLHGYDHPWVGGAGKNKIDENYSTSYTNAVKLQAGTYYYQGFVEGAPSHTNTRLEFSNDNSTWEMVGIPSTDSRITTSGWDGGWVEPGIVTMTFTTTTELYFRVWIVEGTLDNRHLSISSEQLTTFAPYSNICPISGRSEVAIDRVSGEVTDTYTIQLGQTVYGGTLDVTNGKMVVDRGYIASYNGETLPSTWISDRDVYASGTSPTTGAQVVYELATPFTIDLTPTQIKLLENTNTISSDGTMTLEYQPNNAIGEAVRVVEENYETRVSLLESRNTAKVYGFHISSTESDPAAKVTYLADAVGMTPAHMNFSTGTFDYGSWENVWFVRDTKPCLLKDNGQIHRYLNKNNFLKDIDGNDTGVPQITIHTMIEFPKIWYKVVPDIDGKGASIYISPVKVDADYVDYPYIDYQGVHKEHFYMPAYNGSTQTESGTTYLCSTYGETVSKSLTAEQEIAYCKAHGNGWNTEDAGSIMLINFLLILMGKSTDVQSVFGQGLHTSGTEAINNGFTTGIHYNKGMFYGTNSGTIASNNYSNAVKVFGIENYWGFQWRRYAGDILVDGVRKIKLCYGNEDGSSTFDYNLTGNGYVNVGATPSGTSGGYISEMKFTNTGMYSKVSSGSSSTYYCDGQWFNNSGTRYAFRGGNSVDGALCGAFCVSLDIAASVAGWDVGVGLEYK